MLKDKQRLINLLNNINWNKNKILLKKLKNIIINQLNLKLNNNSKINQRIKDQLKKNYNYMKNKNKLIKNFLIKLDKSIKLINQIFIIRTFMMI